MAKQVRYDFFPNGNFYSARGLDINHLITEDTFFEKADCDFYLPTCHGKRIFVKAFNIRELIGEELANFMGRPSIHYFLLERNGIIQLASYPILEDLDHVIYPGDLIDDLIDSSTKTPFDDDFAKGDCIPFFLDYCHTEEAKESFLTNLFQTFAIDTYMRQEDRCSCNCMMYKQSGQLYWAPMYDYEASFPTFKNFSSCPIQEKEELENYLNFFYYYNPFFELGIDQYSFFLEQYPEFRNYLEKIRNVSLSHILTIIKEHFAFSYSQEFTDYWLYQEEISQKVLSKVLDETHSR